MSDLERLRSWSQILVWLSVALPLLGGFCALARFYVDRRASTVASALQVARLAAVEERARPRGLTTEELTLLRAGLAAVAEPMLIELVTPDPRSPLTDVSELVAQQLARLFRERGWHVSFSHTLAAPARGISRHYTVAGAETPARRETFQRFIDALAQLRLSGGGTTDYEPTIEITRVQLVIAANPF